MSALFFYLVDRVQKRYRTRLITQPNSILIINFNLGILILLICLVHIVLPNIIKFITEFYNLFKLVELFFLYNYTFSFLVKLGGVFGFYKF